MSVLLHSTIPSNQQEITVAVDFSVPSLFWLPRRPPQLPEPLILALEYTFSRVMDLKFAAIVAPVNSQSRNAMFLTTTPLSALLMSAFAPLRPLMKWPLPLKVPLKLVFAVHVASAGAVMSAVRTKVLPSSLEPLVAHATSSSHVPILIALGSTSSPPSGSLSKVLSVLENTAGTGMRSPSGFHIHPKLHRER